MSFIPPKRRLDVRFDRTKEIAREADRKVSDYSRTHPDGLAPDPPAHRMVHRLWRVLQGRHHGHRNSSGLR